MNSDRDISQWDARLKEQLERSFHNYHKQRVDLSVARDKKKFNWTGEIIIVEKASSSEAIATVRILFDDAETLTLEENVEIRSIFNRVYLSNAVQADEWLDVIYGINFEYQKKLAEAGAGGGPTLANNEIQIEWTGAASVSVGPGANVTSDVFTFSTNGSFAHIQLKAENEGVPAPGDTVDYLLLLTGGDPDGAGADEYDKFGHALPLGTLDTNVENAALRTVNCPMVKGGKLYAVNNSAGRDIIVSACILEKTVS